MTAAFSLSDPGIVELTADADSGGIAGLALTCSILGIRLDLENVRNEAVKSGRRFDSSEIIRVARRHGLKARHSRPSLTRLPHTPLPAIAQLKDGTFAVLARSTSERVLVVQNGRPPADWSLTDFGKSWSGLLVCIARREAYSGEAMRFGLAWFLPVIRRFGWVLCEVLLLSVFIQIIALISPLFTQVIIDKVLVHHGLTTLQVVCIGLLFVNIADAGLNWLRTYTFAHSTSRIDAILGSLLFRHLFALPIAYFESRPAGQTVARVRELENIRQFITSSALTLVVDVLFGLIFLAVMFYYSVSLSMIVVVAIPCYAAISLLVTPGLRERVREKFSRGAANQSLLVESLGGVQTIKSMAVEPQLGDRWEQQLAAYITSSFRVVTLGAGGAQAIALVNKLTTTAVLWFGAEAVIGNQMTIGQLVAFNMLSGQISAPVLRLAQLWQDFQQFKLSVDRLGDIINTPVERHPDSVSQNLPSLRGDIRFDEVLFRYRPGGQEVLSDLTLEIKAGEVIGIVGRSGSGKSTVTKLLQRLYVPERGRVFIDGIDLALLDPSWLRRQIGVVLQENMLFNRSVRDNIAFFDASLSLDRVIHAAQLAGAHDFIVGLPHAYDTVLEERGANLSGGQRQRIAIARALVADPRILIFDEATSALDYESERIIQDNMRAICGGRTVLVVAHRLSTVRHADRILVMDRGRLVEQGDHDTLMARDGLYAGLVQQAAG